MSQIDPVKLAALRARVSDLTPKQREHFRSQLETQGISWASIVQADTSKELSLFELEERPERLPLSPSQSHVWLLHQLFPKLCSYHIAFGWRFEGSLNPELVETALNQLVERHEALRTVFRLDDKGQPYQYLTPPASMVLEVKNSLNVDHTDYVAEPFDLAEGPLYRMELERENETSWLLKIVIHHLVADGWSRGILMRDFISFYRKAIGDGTVELTPSNEVLSKKTYAVYQSDQSWFESEEAKNQLKYWKKQVDGLTQIELPTDFPRTSNLSFEGKTLTAQLPLSLSERIEALTKRSGATTFMILLAAFKYLLYRYTGEKDISLGVPVSGRRHEECRDIVNFFVNTLVLRTQLETEKPLNFLDWVGEVKKTVLGGLANQFVPFSQVVEASAPDRSSNRNPLFEIMFQAQTEGYMMQNASSPDLALRELKLSQIPLSLPETKFDLSWHLFKRSEGFLLAVEYRSALFTQTRIERMMKHFENLLKVLVENPEIPLSRVGMLDEQPKDLNFLTEEEHTLQSDWEKGEYRELRNSSILDGFAQQVARQAEKIAFIIPETEHGQEILFDYKTLARQSDSLADYLRHVRKLKRGDRVGIYLERSYYLPITLLAVWKCGAAYVPLDKEFPEQRLRFMAEDAELSLILHELDDHQAKEIFSEVLEKDKFLALSEEQFESHVSNNGVDFHIQPCDLAYLIYTSGSTGQPKGVTITHENLLNFMEAMSDAPGLRKDEVLLAVTTISFDISLLELFLPLATGATFVLAPAGAARNGELLSHLIEKYQVDVMQATPTTWQILLETSKQTLSNLRVLCGGEALSYDLAKRLLKSAQELWNLYGPTETTVWSGALRLTPKLLQNETVPIGNPILNTSLRVLSSEGNVVPIGVVGELWIGGKGVSPGYWKRTELTTEKFQDGWYTTGDLVRWREDGLLEFGGRMDGQIKLRGFRIEVGDIESALRRHSEISEAAVIVSEGDQKNKALVGFVSQKRGTDETDLKNFLRGNLPSYMIPHRIISLESLPLTPNRKVDRKALEKWKIEANYSLIEEGFSSTEEERVAKIWEEVLGVTISSRRDHFFEMGGHSLAATRVVGRVHEVLGIRVPLINLFDHPQLADFTDSFLKTSQILQSPINRWNGGTDKLPLSAAQKRQWLMSGLMSDVSTYVIPSAVRIKGDLSIESLNKSWEQVVNKHEGLRLVFKDVMGEPCADVISSWQYKIEEVDLTDQDSVEREKIWQERAKEESNKGFDLSQAPLWRTVLFRLAPQENIFFICFHHILVDGWSVGVVVKEMIAAYQGYLKIQENQLRYVDYAEWQAKQDMKPGLEYWKEALRDLPTELSLPLDFPRPAEISSRGATWRFQLNKKQTDSLHRVSQDAGVTLFMTLQTVLAVLLYRYGAGRDIAIGTGLANRLKSELESIVGLFVNTLVLRNRIEGNPTFRELLLQSKDITLKAYQYQDVPFDEIVELLDVPRSRSTTPLFQVLFALQNAPFDRAQAEGLEWEPISLNTNTAKFDLSLLMQEVEDGVIGNFEYRTELFREETIFELTENFIHLINEIPEALDQPISSLMCLDMLKQGQLVSWGREARPSQLPKQTIGACFQRQVTETPLKIAMVQGNQQITYQELNQSTDTLAKELARLGICTETKVGVIANRSIETIGAMLAILKAGGVFVPLDPSLPQARLDWMIEDAEIAFIYADTREVLETFLPDQEVEIFDQSRGFFVMSDRKPVEVSNHQNDAIFPANLAYIMYTSGSTGTPKGVCATHDGVVRLVRETNYVPLSSEQIILQDAPLGFDASTFEIWGALLNGGSLILTGRGTPTIEEISDLIYQHKVTILWITTGLFHLLIDEGIETIQSVKHIMTGGEVLSMEHLRKAKILLPHTQIINFYGPTEGTTYSTFYPCDHDEIDKMFRAPIGHVISNTEVYILDEDLQLVPRGAEGELYIGGRGLTRGYLKQAARTAENYIPNPFVDPECDEPTDANLTLYKTGDRVRYREDGEIEFLGRMDQQLKIRGFRIEPGEIELALRKHAEIGEAIVVGRTDHSAKKRLVAYVVSENDALEESALRNTLSDKLPPQMIPTKFVVLKQLPLTKNGKFDRSQLPEPTWQSDQNISESGGEIEELLRSTWQSVLPVKEISLQDNFFELGGDSIIALQIISRLKKAGYQATPAQLFQYQTIQEFATIVEKDVSTVPSPLAEPSGEAFEKLPVQQWFQELHLTNPHHFNQAACLRTAVALDRDRLDRALVALFKHHDALRIRWKESNKSKLYYADVSAPSIEWCDEKELHEVVQRVQSSFHLERGPIFLVAGFTGADGSTTLLLVAHHCAVDAVSWKILLEDFYEAYDQAETTESILLPAKTLSYEAWTKHLCHMTEQISESKNYWKKVVGNSATLESFSLKHVIERKKSGVTKMIPLHLSKEETDSFKRNPILPLLLTALGRSFAKRTDKKSMTVMLESHGRDSEALGQNLDLSRTIGWFTSLYPFNLAISNEMEMEAYVKQIQENLDQVPHKGLSYGMLRYLGKDELLSLSPILAFNFLGVIDAGMNLSWFERLPVPGDSVAKENVLQNPIVIDCWIEKDEFQGKWSYNASLFHEEELILWADEFLTHIIDIGKSLESNNEVDADLLGVDSSQLNDIFSQVSFGEES
ncbi:MAG: amino acid adenylation domain-containing protein [Verrucomicrobiota bacterium]